MRFTAPVRKCAIQSARGLLAVRVREKNVSGRAESNGEQQPSGTRLPPAHPALPLLRARTTFAVHRAPG